MSEQSSGVPNQAEVFTCLQKYVCYTYNAHVGLAHGEHMDAYCTYQHPQGSTADWYVH